MLSLKETEIAIKKVKDDFEAILAENLNLTRVSAPLFVFNNSGLNDNLNGYEKPVSFVAKSISDEEIEIVHSLAKWKRMALLHYGFKENEGLYTDMNAIRKDEVVDHLHSIYVDQWDWEKIINKDQRNLDYLKFVVKQIVHSLYLTQEELLKSFPNLERFITDEVFFITTSELEKMYPTLSPKEREHAITKEHHVTFIMQIGWPLANGLSHDGRSPDYDDWNLNGDLFVYNDLLDNALELSSMGIRVDKEAIINQAILSSNEDKLNLEYQQKIINEEVPFTLGGGIGQSRLCMYFLNKLHVGEVQSSYWDDSTREFFLSKGITLL